MKILKSLLLLGLFCLISIGASAQVLLGDANNDGTVNVNDISTIATYILDGHAEPFVFANADANGDGVINVNDITATAAIILGGEDVTDDDVDSQAYLKCPDSNHPHVIDLGLPYGTKWCCCNVGATTPEDYGGYYAWGETSEKSDYNNSTYAYYNSSTRDYTNIGSDIAGTQYDVAHVRMGGSWRMPNDDQIEELYRNCTCTWTQQNGVNGILLTGKNGGQIFLPAAGDRWNDDLYNAISFVVKTIKKFSLKEGAGQPLMPIIKSASEMDYARKLVSYAIVHFKEADEMIKPFLKGWELERIPMMDLTIIRAAVSEMQAFDDIHVGVTMNEYIEIAKTYCAENSVQFVSGVLYQVGKKLQPLEVKEEKK